MLRYIQLFLLVLSVNLYSQFPPPQNFNYQLDYIEFDNWGDCNGQSVFGPSFCSHFSWNLPDTSLTEALLESFEIYNAVNTDTNFIQSLTDTLLTITTPYAGDLFVLAVYSNPSGKSGPSNIVNNPGIPIYTNKIEFEPAIELKHIPEDNLLIIEANPEIKRVRILNLGGQLVFDEKNVTRQIYIGDLLTGVYFIDVEVNHKHYFRKKFLKE